MKRIVSWTILASLLAGAFTLGFNVGLVRAQTETIHIIADGSVSPSYAPVSSVDDITYTFTGNISYPAYFGIIIERSNVVIDGNGYTVQGNYTGTEPIPRLGSSDNSVGLSLTDISNVTVKNANFKNFHFGIVLRDSDNDVITGNNATQNNIGIFANNSTNNIVSGNSATENRAGIYIDYCSNSTVSGNDVTAIGGDRGIYLYASSNNTVSGNNARASNFGIEVDHSSGNIVSGNSATQNGGAIDIDLSSSNNTVSGNTATESISGIFVISSNNTVTGNNATANYYGIDLESASNNTVSGNNAAANTYYGIYLHASSNDTMIHNGFIGNAVQASADSASFGNTWDNGYPSGGNQWSDYNGTDLHSGPYQNVSGSDGIGDAPYTIDANDTDRYPLMGAFSDFTAANGAHVQIVSNSTVSDFQFNGTAILFDVSGMDDTAGFCNVDVPNALMNGTLTVFVNGTQVKYNVLPTSNSTQTYLYFTYGQSTEQVTIAPEFPRLLTQATFMLAILLTVATHKKKHGRP
jgi:parallel beta-helix repeat protein